MIIRRIGRNTEGTTGSFTLAWRGWIVLAAVFGALCLSPAPAAAEIIHFDINSVKLSYEVATGPGETGGILIATQNIGSTFLLQQEEGDNILDSARIDDGNFALTVTLDMEQLGTEDWAATGTLEFTDISLTSKVVGDFTFDAIWIGGDTLYITGLLSTDSASILQPSDAPWMFVGEGPIAPDPPYGDADGIPGRITVDNPSSYYDGSVWVIKVGVDTSLLDTLFGEDFPEPKSGEVTGNITPEPATLSLLVLGGLAILKRRRRAV